MCQPCEKAVRIAAEIRKAEATLFSEGRQATTQLVDLGQHLCSCVASTPGTEKVAAVGKAWNDLGSPYSRLLNFRSGTPRWNKVMARLKDSFWCDNWPTMIQEFRESAFLRGETKRGDGTHGKPFAFNWWVANDENGAKVIEWRNRRLGATEDSGGSAFDKYA